MGDRWCPEHAGRSPRKMRNTREYHRNREAAIERDLGLCSCGAPFASVDHVVPLIEGGTNDVENLACKCKTRHDLTTANEDEEDNQRP